MKLFTKVSAICLSLVLSITCLPMSVFANSNTKKMIVDNNISENYQTGSGYIKDFPVTITGPIYHYKNSNNIRNVIGSTTQTKKAYMEGKYAGTVTSLFLILCKYRMV